MLDLRCVVRSFEESMNVDVVKIDIEIMYSANEADIRQTVIG